jgi:glyceraldehyde 3-phosphate dehydrogenase
MKEPSKLYPGRPFGVDVVLESTGKFTDRAGAEKHLKACAEESWYISAPAKKSYVTLCIRVLIRRFYDKKKHDVILHGFLVQQTAWHQLLRYFLGIWRGSMRL